MNNRKTRSLASCAGMVIFILGLLSWSSLLATDLPTLGFESKREAAFQEIVAMPQSQATLNPQDAYSATVQSVIAMLSATPSTVIATPTPTNTVQPTVVITQSQPITPVILPVCPGGVMIPTNAVTISVVYGPDFAGFMQEAINNFNCVYANKIDPLTGVQLADDQMVIYVTGESVSSGDAMERIVRSISVPNGLQPTLYIPSSRLWLSLANADRKSGYKLFDVPSAPAIGITPVVIGIWESYLNALQRQYPNEQIGWKHLFDLYQASDGWQSFGVDVSTVNYGHTSPYLSSTGLSAWLLEYYTAARFCANIATIEELTAKEVEKNQQINACVRQIEQTVRHYLPITTSSHKNIAQGPDYVALMPLEETDVIAINRNYNAPEKLVALYPSDGTLLNDHPAAIPNTYWTNENPTKVDAAKVFIQFLLTRSTQETLPKFGFRPVHIDIQLTEPFVPKNGVDPQQPTTVLELPWDNVSWPNTVEEIQSQWGLTKKTADIVILFDVSGSMATPVSKLQEAQTAAQRFLEKQYINNRVGLTQFSSEVTPLIKKCKLEEWDEQEKKDCRQKIFDTLSNLKASGNTSLFKALIDTINEVTKTADSSRIQAIILISDGQDDLIEIEKEKQRVLDTVEKARNSDAHVLVIPIAYAYAENDDDSFLRDVAERSQTTFFEGGIPDIEKLLEEIREYF